MTATDLFQQVHGTENVKILVLWKLCCPLSLDRYDQPLHNFKDPVSIFKAE